MCLSAEIWEIATRNPPLITERTPWIIAHRGASAAAPENTLAAVRTAWEMDADAVEVDIQCTRDARAVVIHDRNTRRTTGTRLKVAAATLAALQRLDAGSFKDACWEHERIPALREVLAAVPPGKRLVIELKAGPEILAPLAADLAAATHLDPAQVVLIAFSRELAQQAKARLPHLAVLWIGDPRRKRLGVGFRPTTAVRRMAATAQKLGLDGLDLYAHRCLSPALVEEIHALGLRLFVWTVNRPKVADRLLRAGVDGLTTDVPDLMLAIRNARDVEAAEQAPAQKK